MKILVIQTAKGYLEMPKYTQKLEIKLIRDKQFIATPIEIVRLPKEMYVASFDIYDGTKSFGWTQEAKDNLGVLMSTVDYVIADDRYNPWYHDTIVYQAVHEAGAKVLVWDNRLKKFVRQWA